MPKIEPNETPKENKPPVPTPPTGDWNPPASQEELDRIIGDRLARERGKYADYTELKEKAAKFDEVQEAAKSEAEKQAERMAALEAENTAYREREKIAGWTASIAKDTGVPGELLRGSTEEELRAHAEALKDAGIGQPSAPLPVPTIGVQPSLVGNATVGEQIAAAEKAGDAGMVARLKAIQLGAAFDK